MQGGTGGAASVPEALEAREADAEASKLKADPSASAGDVPCADEAAANTTLATASPGWKVCMTLRADARRLLAAVEGVKTCSRLQRRAGGRAGAPERARGRRAAAAAWLLLLQRQLARKTKVEELDDTPVERRLLEVVQWAFEHRVRRLDVAVDDAPAVQVEECR